MLSNFDISIVKLKNTEHIYDFHLDNDFFTLFDNHEIQQADLKVILKLKKNERVIMAQFEINGFIGLICDRSLESYQEEMSIIDTVVYKFGDVEEVISEALIQITSNTHFINIGQLLFEMVAFAVPMKKLHPRFRTEDDEAVFIYTSSTSSADEGEAEQSSDNELDPRWSSLSQLKDKFKKPE